MPGAGAVLRQQDWTEEALRAAGFRYFLPHKRLVLARELRCSQTIVDAYGPLQARPGDMLCVRPGALGRGDAVAAERWPVRRDRFLSDYRLWDEAVPGTADVEGLLKEGFSPWYKVGGVWARRLGETLRVKSLESPTPVCVAPGYWVLVGSAGEPWHMDDGAFRSRYLPAEEGSSA